MFRTTHNTEFIFLETLKGVTLKMKWIQQLLNDNLPKLVQLKYADAPAWPGRLLLPAHQHQVSSYQQPYPSC